MVLTLIAVMDEDRLLADADGIPWRLPDDVTHFRQYTAGKWLLLGRTTYEEMRGWFREGHHPLVLSSRCGWDPETGRLVSSVPHAVALAEAAGAEELVCLGGAETFAAALPHADKMLLTRVRTHTPAGVRPVRFPVWDASGWSDVRLWSHCQDAAHPHAFELHELKRLR